MSCQRANEIDLASFMVDPNAAEQREFRAHYPDCVDCSASVAQWSALDAAIRSGPSDASGSLDGHPTTEELEQFVDAPGSLSAAQTRVREHVDRCESCASEVSLLRRFDPVAIGIAAAAGAAERADATSPTREPIEEPRSWLDPIRDFFESLAPDLLFRPAAIGSFAIALLAIAGLWAGGFLADDPSNPLDPSEDNLLAEVEDPPAPAEIPEPTVQPKHDPAAAPGPDPIRVEQLAEERPSPVPPSTPKPGAVRQGHPDVPPPSPIEDPVLDQGEQEIVLLAALDDFPLPTYTAPPDAASIAWMVELGTNRGAGEATPAARAPDHVGFSLSPTPRLWWELDIATERTLQLSVLDEEAIEPLLEIDLPGPHAAGLHSISLADHAVELSPETEYRWFVSLVIDPNRPTRNPTSGGAIEVVKADDGRRIEIDSLDPSARGHRLAELGLWYDAYDFFAQLQEAHPDTQSALRHRDHLVESSRGAR